MKIAIVRLSSLGDIVKNASVLQFVKSNINCEITWIADTKFADVLDNTPYLDNLIKLPLKNTKKNLTFKNIKRIFNLLPKNEFDIVIDSHGFIKSALISRYISKKDVFGFSGFIKEKLSNLFYTKSFNFECNENEVYRYNKLFALSLGYKFEKDDIYKIKMPFLSYENKDYSLYSNILDWHDVILIIGASKGWEVKKYPMELWKKIIKNSKLNYLVIWGSEQEREEASFLAELSNVKVAPKLSINDLKYVLSKGKLVVGNDTGPIYISWAFGVKTIVLFGCTDNKAIAENKNVLTLKSSSKVNYCKFDKNDFSIKEIDYKRVLDAIYKLKG